MDNLYSSLESQYGLPEGSLSAIRGAEKSDTYAVSPKGAKGRFQFMPDTAKAYGVNTEDDISSAIGAAKYLADLKKQYGSFKAAVAHYNGGNAAAKAVLSGQEPPASETQNYLKNVSRSMAIDPNKVQIGSAIREPIDPNKVQIESAASEPINPAEVKFGAEAKIPAKEPSSITNAAEGFAKAFKDLAQGAKQKLDIPAQFLEKQFAESPVAKFGVQMGMPTAAQSAQQTQQDIINERSASAPMMETLPGQAGYIGGQLAANYLGGKLLQGAGAPTAGQAISNPMNYKQAMTAGGIQGALQPTLPEESSAFNTLAGTAAGGLGLSMARGLGNIAQPIKEGLAPAYQKAVDVLKNSGIPLDAAQATGSTLLNRAKSMLGANPVTAGAEEKLIEQQKAGFNRAALATIGEKATAATSDVMKNARERIDGVFKDILDRNNVSLTDDIVSRVAKIQEGASEAEKKPIANLATRIFKSVDENGQISGQNAYQLKKDLDLYAGDMKDTTMAHYARQLKSTLMDAINGSLDEADQASFSQARNQFRNMKTIEGAIDKEGTGSISPARLANIMNQKSNRATSIYGKGDQSLVELAQAGNMILKDKLPNSGTVQRAAALLAPGAVTAAATGAYTGDWEKAGEYGLAGIAIPKGVQMALRSPAFAKYMTEGMGKNALRDLLEKASESATLKKLPLAYEQQLMQSYGREK